MRKFGFLTVRAILLCIVANCSEGMVKREFSGDETNVQSTSATGDKPIEICEEETNRILIKLTKSDRKLEEWWQHGNEAELALKLHSPLLNAISGEQQLQFDKMIEKLRTLRVPWTQLKSVISIVDQELILVGFGREHCDLLQCANEVPNDKYCKLSGANSFPKL